MLARATRQASARLVGRRFQSSVQQWTPNIKTSTPKVPNAEKARAYIEENEHTVEHAKGSMVLWRNICYFVCIPALVGCGIFVYNVEMKHAEHNKHLIEIPDEEWPKDYEYQNIRNRKYPWRGGDKTLFWNDKFNRHVQED
jgi:cytochrome c oxidase subunit 6a